MIDFTNFSQLKEYIAQNSFDSLLLHVLSGYLHKPEITDLDNLSILIEEAKNIEPDGFVKLMNLTCTYKYIEQKLHDLIDNIEQYEWVYDNVLLDLKSRQVFLNLMAYRLDHHKTHLTQIAEPAFRYFDPSIVKFQQDEIFVDCGGFIGDTTAEFILNCPNYKKIYIYEPDYANYKSITNLIQDIVLDDSISIYNYAVSDRSGDLSFDINANNGSHRISITGERTIRTISLDEAIQDKITFLKMDIEGSEIEAIMGAKKHIECDTPLLSISIYHKFDDMYKIPRIVSNFNKNYDFYLRHHFSSDDSDTVLYAIPRANNHTLSKEQSIVAGRYNQGSFARLYKELYYIDLCKNKLLTLSRWIIELEQGKSWLETEYYKHINAAKVNNKTSLLKKGIRKILNKITRIK